MSKVSTLKVETKTLDLTNCPVIKTAWLDSPTFFPNGVTETKYDSIRVPGIVVHELDNHFLAFNYRGTIGKIPMAQVKLYTLE